jgi:NTE family protein
MIKKSGIPNMLDTIENVLILQGGGSLGAFACGVFKALVKSKIKIDIVAGTSIGGVNATIIAGSKDDHPEEALEQFWLELGEGSSNFNFPPELVPDPTSLMDFPTTSALQVKSILSFYNSAIYGNKNVFLPRWLPRYSLTDPQYFTPYKWTYLFDHSPLLDTLEKYVNFNKLQPDGNSNARLIITAVNILNAEPLIFDSSKQQITPMHILGATGYPTYYFQWAEVEKGIYAWDGSLLSNTPLREVIDASPINDKRIFLVENYPKNTDKLPTSIQEVQHRARDIMFSDKTLHNIQMSKAITYYLRLIDDLYNMLEHHFKSEKKEERAKFEKMRAKYKKIKEEHGSEIKNVFYITRDERFPSLYENADFSLDTIKNSIRDGESKTNQILKDVRMD